MLPYFWGRPVTLQAFPGGIHSPGHYRRNLTGKAVPGVVTADYQGQTTAKPTRLLEVEHAAGLIALANQGNLEFHLWSSRQPNLEYPDQVIFDLDPGERASFAEVRQAALLLRGALEGLGLQGHPKTSGGRGLHVYVPITPKYSFDEVHNWSRSLSEQLAQAHPELLALPSGGTHHGRYVTLDYVQNSVARNTAAPYTLRARPGAPVSTPLTWPEVEAGSLDPSDLTLRVVPDRVKQLGDVFVGALGQDQRLPGM